MIIGPYINALAIISGAVIGTMLGGRIPERLRTNLTLIFGLCSMGMGIVMVAKTTNMPAMILSVLLGTIIGELLLLEQGINKLASSAKGLVEKMFPDKPSSMNSQEEFLSKFVAIVVLFSFSGTGIFGAMNEGMTGDFDILTRFFHRDDFCYITRHFGSKYFCATNISSSDLSLFRSIYYSFRDT